MAQEDGLTSCTSTPNCPGLLTVLASLLGITTYVCTCVPITSEQGQSSVIRSGVQTE